MEGIQGSGRAKSVRDAGYHLAYLAEALAAEDRSLFAEYTAWVLVLFAGLDFPEDVLVTTLACTRDVLRSSLAREDYAITEKYLDAGLRAIKETPLDPPSHIESSAPLGRLARAGYRVLEAEEGREALRLARAQKPDLAVIDVVLRDIGGIQVCREIKEDDTLESMGVILLSGLETASESQAAGLEAGADDYVARPLSNRELLARVEALLRLKRARDELRRQAERLKREVTERKRAEQALEEHREHLEDLVEDRTWELQEAQERLLRREKLAVLGQLAGGVSHELRGPLEAIKNVAYFLTTALEEERDPEVKEMLDILEREVKRSDAIIRDLLNFARTRTPERRPLNVNHLLEEIIGRTDVPSDVQVILRLKDSLPTLLADPYQLDQLFDNLIQNAIQAMPEGGRLTVTTSGDSRRALTSGGEVTVSIADTGVGILKDDIQRVFEPLFTTKAKGIGLGLALAKTLVEAHDGTIAVRSEVGQGTTFTVRLTICAEEQNSGRAGEGERRYP